MQEDALDLLQELQNHPQYSSTKLKHYINRGIYTFVRKTKCLEGIVEITTVADQVKYDESDESDITSIMIPYQVRYVDGTEVGRALKTWVGGYTNLPKKYSYGTPYYYWLKNVHARSVTAPSTYTGVELGTWPICSSSGKTIQVDAFFRPQTLVADDDESEIQLEWHDAPVFYGVARMFGMFGHLRTGWQNKSLFYMSEFERMVGEANEFMINQSDEPIETQDVYYEMDSAGGF